MVTNKAATTTELLKSGIPAREIRQRIIEQRRGIPQMKAEKQAAEQFRNTEFTNINQYRETLNQLPAGVRRRLTKFEKIQEQQKGRIQDIDKEIAKAEQQLTEFQVKTEQADREGRKDREAFFRARQSYYRDYIRGLKEGKERLEQGDILDKGKITSYASRLGSAAESQEEARYERKQQIQSLGFENITDYAKAKPTLSKLQAGKGTLSDVEKLPEQLQERITFTESDMPTESITSEAKGKVTSNVYQNIFTGEKVSAAEAPGAAWRNVIVRDGKVQPVSFAESLTSDLDFVDTPKIQRKVELVDGIPVSTTKIIDPTKGLFEEGRITDPSEEQLNQINERIQADIYRDIAFDKPEGILERSRSFLSKARQDKDSPIIGFASSFLDLAELGYATLTDPIGTGKAVGKGITELPGRFLNEGFPEVGRTLRFEPGFATGFITAEVVQGFAGDEILKRSSQLGSTTISKLSPRYSKVDTSIDFSKIRIKPQTNPNQGILDLIDAPIEESITISSKFDDVVDLNKKITFASKLDDIKVPLTEQVELAGTTGDFVSAQRGLFGRFETTKLVDKPVPGQELLSKETLKRLDKQFSLDLTDSGMGYLGADDVVNLNLDADSLARLNKDIIEQTGSKGLLEKSFFASPSTELRVSRLGVLDEPPRASFVDFLSGDFTLRKGKPQVLLFEGAEIEDLPLNLKQKIRGGKTLTAAEEAQLLQFELTPSGKFKPIGFLSQEPEITLAPTEVIRRGKKVATTTYKPEGSFFSKRIDIFSSEIEPNVRKFKGRDISDLSKKDLLELDKQIKAQSKLSYEISSQPYVSPYTIGTTSLIQLASQLNYEPSKTIKSNNYEIVSNLSKPKTSSPVSISISKIDKSLSIGSELSPRKGSPYIGSRTSEIPEIKQPRRPIPKRFNQIRRRKKKKQTSELDITEPLIYPVGFTAANLGIKRKLTEKQLLGLATSPSRAVGIRAGFELVGGKKSNKKKRRTNKLSLMD